MTRKDIRLTGLALATLICTGRAVAGSLSTPYTDPDQFTRIDFGKHSHWAQPWRAYLETMPATTFLNGTGVNFNVNGQDPDLIAKMLARHGIHHARIEIGWGNINPDDETQLNNAAPLAKILHACKQYRLRPLILLNANSGVPCPLIMFSRNVTATAHKGDTTVQLDSTKDLRIGHSGLSNLSDYCAAEGLITKIEGRVVTLSKPLPKDIPAGTLVPIATLKYRPFSNPDGDDDKATVAGWQRYVGTVARFVSGTLGTTGSTDKGFDMEIWNELTFGSRFLSIDNYYAVPPDKYDPNVIWSNLVAETAAYADSHPSDFAGVQFGDGFANTIPWPSSSKEPARITAIDKHPYAGRKNYPQDNQHGDTLNALYQKDDYVPTYTALFPEYYATALQTETIVREMAPITTDLYGTKRGRFARVAGTRTIPCQTWITEVNIAPSEDQSNIASDRALAIKAKAITRYFCFFLNKGVTQLDIYAAAPNDAKLGDKELGLVQQNFLDYARKPDVGYPADDTTFTSPALAAVGHIVDHMKRNIDTTLSETRPLHVTALSDTHDHAQFKGDGTRARPDLYDRDVFAFLPYQVNARRFVIPYYVMTRDITKDAGVEKFTLTVQGLHGVGATVSVYDPIHDISVPVTVKSRAADSLTLTLTTGDYPYLLTVQEAGPAMSAAKKNP
jgi:hypothetical protein